MEREEQKCRKSYCLEVIFITKAEGQINLLSSVSTAFLSIIVKLEEEVCFMQPAIKKNKIGFALDNLKST